MGRKTLESLPNSKPLPNRMNIVLTRDQSFMQENVIPMQSIKHLVAYMDIQENINNRDVFVIGGESIYKTLLPHCSEVLVTKINGRFKADTYFPNLDKLKEWEIAEETEPHTDNGCECKYVTYKRKVD